jgi:DNA (cytosine-5)-methyltransferase 1
MRYLSVCSGIEAATVAWHGLGWKPVAFSEIEAFPSAVLAHHYPDVPNVGDMTKYKEWNLGAVDLLVGGTPCQSFSVAGLRKGLEDPRGNLALVYCGILDHFRPKWFVWENVPGVLSSGGGRDFGSFVGALAELGYGFAYRVLDAQYFGVAQRRRRVFVVGHLGDWRPAAEVLFESESLRRDTAPSRKAGQAVAPCVTNGPPFSRTGNERVEAEAMVVQPFPVANTLTARMHKGMNSDCNEGQTPVVQRLGVRRLTPVECERLQGFPDQYTSIPWRKSEVTPDGPRYKALGNSMAVPVMAWIGKRIKEVNA